MNLHPKRLQLPGGCCLCFCLLGASMHAQAGGFALIEHGASGMGNAYAGAAAVSADASTIWFNPAGMTEIEQRELAIAGHVLITSTEFTDEGSALNQLFGAAQLSGPDTAEPGGTTFLPNLYYVSPINDQWSYGIGFGVPFGSSTEYDADWKGRYTTVESSVNAIDINPSIAWRMSDTVRFGAGISVQILNAELSNAVDTGAVCLGGAAQSAEPDAGSAACVNAGLLPGVQANDGLAEVTGDSTTVTFNIGALFLPRPDTRIGVAYRHGGSHDLDGDVDFTGLEAVGVAGALFQDGGITGAIDLPATFSVSGAHQLNNKVQLLGDITWTGWSSFDELRIVFDDADNAVQPDSVSTQDWDDVFRVSAGINYQHNEKWTLRGGWALDQEAIPNPQKRTARIPGTDRTWIAFGAGYKVSKRVSLDFGYTHLFLAETPIDNPSADSAIGTTVRGQYDASVNIVSAQFNWHFN